jgi:hypothetical protein
VVDQLIVNVTPFETRVALIEDNAIAEVFIERHRDRGIVGNIYLGKVQRVLPGMQAALDEGVDVIGIARPLTIDLKAANALLDGTQDHLPAWEQQLQERPGFFGPKSPIKLIRTIQGVAGIYWYYSQFYRLGRGQPAEPNARRFPMR